MSYNLEALGDERFQQLCQAILTCAHPNVQCLPVGQPDGGRDAFLLQQKAADSSAFVVFQVKYVKDPHSRAARDLVEQTIASEQTKVRELIARGATAYHLLTNVAGTSHLHVGSIDKANAALRDAFGIETHCWWRDDIERRIDTLSNIKWSYPEIIRGPDVLQFLIGSGIPQEDKRRSDALRAYIAYQAKYDAQMKFKQVDLQKSIVDLFVDVPVCIAVPPSVSSAEAWLDEVADPGLNSILLQSAQEIELADADLTDLPGAVHLLARSDLPRLFPRVVLEGAPGQGKSTVTQFLCQVHRLLFLSRLTELEPVAEHHRPKEARIPFRVDLRDYASWVNGRDPFDQSNSDATHKEGHLLECFLAAQVHRLTGLSFTVDDLTAVARLSQLLIVLDGFDEVADIPSRNRLVAEISDAATRLEANAISLQLIVTSRPAAFANSPGFSREDWQHFQLVSLSLDDIERYADKWLDGRGADEFERREIQRVLADKLQEAHVRDLARNPMQLAILLFFISVKGASLPDKRTALYDEYIDIFLNREAEKSPIVRDHRDLLVQMHRYLAWKLQVEAESSSGSGKIPESRLLEMLRVYLEATGHDTLLLNALFTGMQERVGAIVSRVKGTYEFEVQPLREYFAARYLYDTAPYSPPGSPRSGTRPERFEAITRNFYWLNVARFYAGCYSTGELASLSDCIDELAASEQFKFTSHPRRLCSMLLADYVFSQQPKLVERVVARLTAEPGVRLWLAAGRSQYSATDRELPSKSGRARLVQFCRQKLANELKTDTLSAVCRTLAANSPYEEIHATWLDLRALQKGDDSWIRLGGMLGVFDRMPPDECARLVGEHGRSAVTQVAQRRANILEGNEGALKELIEHVLDLGISVLHYPRDQAGPLSLIQYFSLVISPYIFHSLRDMKNDASFDHINPRLRHYRLNAEHALRNDDLRGIPLSRSYLDSLLTLTGGNIGAWKKDLSCWSQLIEPIRSGWGDRWSLCLMAILAAQTVRRLPTTSCDITDGAVSLCDRAAFARAASQDMAWWRKQILNAGSSSPLMQQFVLMALLAYVSVDKIIALGEDISAALDALPEPVWRDLTASWGVLSGLVGGEGPFLAKGKLPSAMSSRLAAFLIARVGPYAGRHVYTRFLSDYRGTDRSVLTACVNAVMDRAVRRQDEWRTALPIIAYAYESNVYSGADIEDNNVPEVVARQVCSDPDRYPLSMVRLAEGALTAIASANVVPLGEVAAREGWFAGQFS